MSARIANMVGDMTENLLVEKYHKGYYYPTRRKDLIGITNDFSTAIFSLLHGAAPEVLIFVVRCQGIDVNER